MSRPARRPGIARGVGYGCCGRGIRVGNSGGRGRIVGVATDMRKAFGSRGAASPVRTLEWERGRGARLIIPVCHRHRPDRTWVPKRTGSNKPLPRRLHPTTTTTASTTATPSMTTSWTSFSPRLTRATPPFGESLRLCWRRCRQSRLLHRQLLLIKQAAKVGSRHDRCAPSTTPALRG